MGWICFESRRDLLAGAGLVFLATILFGWAFGFDLWNPNYHSWLLSGDSLVHFMGFNTFLRGPWNVPPGLVAGYNAPLGTSLVYTDSIPLLSLLLKAVAPGSIYQFHGIWIWFCWVAQFLTGYLLVRQAGQTRGVAFAGACLIGTLPCFLARATGGIRHYTLLAHFLVIWPMLLYFLERTGRRAHASLLWGGLLVLEFGVHFYLLFFALVFYALAEIHRSAGIRLRKFHLGLGAVLLSAAWSFGYFSIPMSNVNHGLAGEVSMNLFSLLTPFRSQRFPVQIEGYVYLGLGLVFLSVASIGLQENRFKIRSFWNEHREGWELIAVWFLLLYALSIYFPFGEWRLNRWLTVLLYLLLS